MSNIKPITFAPASADNKAHLPRNGSKSRTVVDMGRRDCGVSLYELAARLTEAGGSACSPSYARSWAAKSFLAPLGFGIKSDVKAASEHVEAVKTAAGDETAEYVKQSLPASVLDADGDVLVLHVYVADGGVSTERRDATVDGKSAKHDSTASAAATADHGEHGGGSDDTASKSADDTASKSATATASRNKGGRQRRQRGKSASK